MFGRRGEDPALLNLAIRSFSEPETMRLGGPAGDSGRDDDDSDLESQLYTGLIELT